ncbi:uncharacterized protein LOC130673747 isoform X2 [Microplitis mediator]|uniref:uncharacterized protein LOC130673747 isoform X2 n=1 Tax=Microplitis mediator TaxID=375433 RepID=UPI002557BED1|nr:uncharacterized protein LOC130673747 isoform X2 [Microplitis mediator]
MQQKLFFERKNVQKYDLYRSLKNIIFYVNLVFFKVVGLVPWKTDVHKIFNNKIHNYHIYPFEVSKFGAIYNVVLIIIMFTYMSIGVILGQLDQDYIDSIIVKTIDKTLKLYGTILMLIVWLIYILQQKKIVDILNKLYQINNSLKSCKKYKFQNNYCIYIISFGNIIMCFSILLLEYLIDSVLTFLLWAAPFIVASSVLVQYALLINIIIQIFKSINATILKLGNINTGNKIKTVFFRKVLLEESIINDIDIINYYNLKLCELCSEISDFYALPTLLIAIYFITSSTYNLHFLIMSLITSSEEFLLAVYLLCSVWFLAIMIDFAVLTTSVTRITREFVKTSHCIFLLSKECTLDLNTRSALTEFLNSLLHQNLEFTTHGVINLDGSLLQNILGTIVTYLIILIQFRPRE